MTRRRWRFGKVDADSIKGSRNSAQLRRQLRLRLRLQLQLQHRLPLSHQRQPALLALCHPRVRLRPVDGVVLAELYAKMVSGNTRGAFDSQRG
jgi:hypothetical protein